jgi:glycosyltransferase involved in cell wall biosynthesis
MKLSVTVTVLNEAETILALLFGLSTQTKLPNEVIIVDGGSTDQTVQIIKVFQKKYSGFPINVFVHQGNRSQGRNFAIKKAQYDWVAITDAGCVPHVDWLENLTKKARQTKAEVIAGFYDACFETVFQTAVVPYMLVMPDRVNADHFLPATRSMLIKKKVWQETGGFNEALKVSEDYDFAHKLDKGNYRLSFSQEAMVSWWPMENLKDFYQTVREMAKYDAKAGIIRIKAYLVFCRYLIFLLLALVFLCSHWLFCLGFVLFSIIIYSLWAMWKNAQYLDRGWLYLPVLQLTADVGVMVGTMLALFQRT